MDICYCTVSLHLRWLVTFAPYTYSNHMCKNTQVEESFGLKGGHQSAFFHPVKLFLVVTQDGLVFFNICWIALR